MHNTALKNEKGGMVKMGKGSKGEKSTPSQKPQPSLPHPERTNFYQSKMGS
jgi:hypothetical protein